MHDNDAASIAAWRLLYLSIGDRRAVIFRAIASNSPLTPNIVSSRLAPAGERAWLPISV
jgi:hypothetical protein